MGISCISWQEVKAWADLTGRNNRWLLSTLKYIGSSYVQEFNLSSDPSRPSPYQDDLDVEVNREAVRKQFASFMKAKAR